MPSLYEIDQAVLTVLEDGLVFDPDSGEILWDEENFAELEIHRTDKMENVALYIKGLESDASAIKAEEKALAERRSIKEKKAERLRDYLTRSMEAFGDTKLETPRVALSFRKSEAVDIWDADELPPIYWKQAAPTPDKAAIKKAIKSGEEVSGASLVERRNLQIK